MRIKRCVSAYLDIMIIGSISQIIIIFLTKFDIRKIFENFYAYLLFGLFLFLLKDLVFRNASIGKRALNLEILKSDNTVPSVSTLILRNIFVFLWPIDAILILANKRKIGDIIFKTKVVEKEYK